MSKKNGQAAHQPSMGEDLPIQKFKNQIIDAVRQNSVVVITAETGAGKSTQVPQYLLAEGYDLVVTQPRRLAARSVAARVAEEMGVELGGLVGFRTAQERQDSPSTRCLFCTDGLALVRELMGANKGVLVLDEVHEWNENMEVLVAWAKQSIEAGADMKVVLMSATMEAEKLSAFFNDAPVISVPGRLFPVEIKQAGSRLVDDVATLVAQGRNVLVFQPGKTEIEVTCAALRQMQVNAEILPLHGQLTSEEQSRCFRHYGRPKVIVSTNVAQTSVTIDDIDAVVDSGMERRIELVDGVEGLYLKPISYADATQRKGRAGRVKPGIYIDHCGASTRPDFPVAEIMRKRLDQTVLRLAIAGFDMEAMEFFHQPNRSDIHDARRTLIGLGCMTQTGEVTAIGKLVNRLPVAVQYARMLVEADRLGVVDDVLTVAAIMEQGGIVTPPPSRNQPDRPDWRHMVPSESESDVMGQLAVWKMAENMTKGEMSEKGVSIRSYFRAKEIRKHLADALQRYFRFGSNGKRENILKAVCAGMVDHLFKGSYGSYRNGDDTTRELGESSLVRGAAWLVGKPFDLQVKTKRGLRTLNLIELASKVDPAWLTEVAPHLASSKTGLNPWYNPEKDICVSTTQVFFNGRLIAEEQVVDPHHPEAARLFATWFATEQMRDAALERAKSLNARAGETVFPARNREEMLAWATQQLAGARRLEEIKDPASLIIPEPDAELAALVLEENPDQIALLGKSVTVEYYEGRAPRVTLDRETAAAHGWRDLPNTGVKLPGGRLVEVAVPFGYHETISGQNVLELKERCASKANQGLWNNWWDRPAIALPDPSDVASFVPEIIECQYGVSVVDGTPLMAFGTVALNAYHYYSSDPWLKSEWYQVREEAETARTNAVAKLEELRKEAIEQKRTDDERREAEAKAQAEIAAAKTEAEAVKAELKALTSNELCSADNELYHRAYAESGCYSWLPSTAEELRAWTVKTRAIIVQVQAVLADFQRQQEAEAQAKALAEQTKRAELADLLAHPCVCDNLDLAERIDAFVTEAIKMRGARDAARFLTEESREAYGRARRTSAIGGRFPGIEHRGLDWAAGRDIEAVAFWTERKAEKPVAKPQKQTVSQPTDTKPADVAQVAATLDALKARFGSKTSRR